MNVHLEKTLSTLNLIKFRSYCFRIALSLAFALSVSFLVFVLCTLLTKIEGYEPLILAFLTFILVMIADHKNYLGHESIKPGHFLFFLETKNPETYTSAFSLKQEINSPIITNDWLPRLDQEIRELKKREQKHLLNLSIRLLPAILLVIAAFFLTRPKLSTAWKNLLQKKEVSLTILDGSAIDGENGPFSLSGRSPLNLELLAQNMIEIRVTGLSPKTSPPIIELRRLNNASEKDAPNDGNNELFQSFQMIKHKPDEKTSLEFDSYSVAFAITSDVRLVIPTLFGGKFLAAIHVKKLPTPEVELTSLTKVEDPWPDDKALLLRINVKAKNPLQVIRLVIQSGGKMSQELVNNIMTEDMYSLETTYSLLLEPYVFDDFSVVEIYAEAQDKSIPVPLIGRSTPLRLNTASAYGRYRQTLHTLGELKKLVDENVGEKKKSLPPEATETSDKASRQALSSPFFDALDRMHLNELSRKIQENSRAPDYDRLLDLSADLDNFLFEHELLDDRERDRDFFIAARSLSRVIEEDKKTRDTEIGTVVKRIDSYLQDRHNRWVLRVNRLGEEFKPKTWPKIRDQRPFQKDLIKIVRFDNVSPPDKSRELSTLSQTVVSYRNWIEELEKNEDLFRESQDQKRQQVMASAKDELKELQKRQDQISRSLDNAAERPEKDLADNWPENRMKQNTNINDTRDLAAKLKIVAPRATTRIEAALKSMELTAESGNENNFMQAESASDSAARLLRQAESAANQEKEERQRGRRRRVSGNNYYGQAIVGGDVEIKREYQVDRRYREEVLDEIKHADLGEDNQKLLNDYLRQIIR